MAIESKPNLVLLLALIMLAPHTRGALLRRAPEVGVLAMEPLPHQANATAAAAVAAAPAAAAAPPRPPQQQQGGSTASPAAPGLAAAPAEAGLKVPLCKWNRRSSNCEAGDGAHGQTLRGAA